MQFIFIDFYNNIKLMYSATPLLLLHGDPAQNKTSEYFLIVGKIMVGKIKLISITKIEFLHYAAIKNKRSGVAFTQLSLTLHYSRRIFYYLLYIHI